MTDKVLAIVRETMLHENALRRSSFLPGSGEALLELLQPDDRAPFLDHELLLTFAGVKSLSIERMEDGGGEDVLGIECEWVGEDYHARIVLGECGRERWSIRLTFADLTYKRGLSVF